MDATTDQEGVTTPVEGPTEETQGQEAARQGGIASVDGQEDPEDGDPVPDPGVEGGAGPKGAGEESPRLEAGQPPTDTALLADRRDLRGLPPGQTAKRVAGFASGARRRERDPENTEPAPEGG